MTFERLFYKNEWKMTRREISAEKVYHCRASHQKTSPLSTKKLGAKVRKEDEHSPLKLLRSFSQKKSEIVDESSRNSVGLKNSANMFTKNFVLGKRSEACRGPKRDDNKTEDTLSFDACNSAIKEVYKHEPDLGGLPLKKFKKMSLESFKVTKLPQDIKVCFKFIVY